MKGSENGTDTRQKTANSHTLQYNLEALVGARWEVIIRYDCSHDHPHVHKYDIMGREIKKMLNLNFENALTFSEWDIDENWQKYVQKFNKGKK